MPRGRKPLQRIITECDDCGLEIKLIMEKSKLAAVGVCKNHSRGKTNVALLSKPGAVLDYYLTSNTLSEDSSNKEMWIIRAAFKGFLEQNNIEYHHGWGRNKIINFDIKLPNKYKITVKSELIDYLGNNVGVGASHKKADELEEKFLELTQSNDIYITGISELKNKLSEIKSWLFETKGKSIDSEILRLNREMFELNQEWAKNEVPVLIKDIEKHLTSLYGDKWKK